MKSSVKVLIVMVLLVLVIGGAGLGYKFLSERYKEKEAEERTTKEEVTTEADDNVTEITDKGSDSEQPEDIGDTGKGADGEQPEDMGDTGKGADGEQPENADGIGEQVVTAPDFKFLNMDGEEVHLTDYFGKPVLLNFWATWCGPCQMEMPYFDTAYQKYGEDINFLIVDLTDGSRDTVESAKAFVEDKGFSFPIGFDTEYNGAYTYSVSSIPMTFFIDKDGVIQFYQIGAIEENVLNEQLELLIGR